MFERKQGLITFDIEFDINSNMALINFPPKNKNHFK